MARAMPVLPDVGSIIRVFLSMTPRFSASYNMHASAAYHKHCMKNACTILGLASGFPRVGHPKGFSCVVSSRGHS